jgi:hypothetical protein
MGTKTKTGVRVMPLYQSFDVWKRISKTRAVRYCCFRELSSGRFSVQSAGFYSVPLDPKQAADLEKQYMELFAEQDPDERAGSFDSLEAAIEAHDKDFVSETEGAS